MRNSKKKNPLSIEKFTVAKLNNPNKIFGGDPLTTNDTQTDGNNKLSTLICLDTNGNG